MLISLGKGSWSIHRKIEHQNKIREVQKNSESSKFWFLVDFEFRFPDIRSNATFEAGEGESDAQKVASAINSFFSNKQ